MKVKLDGAKIKGRYGTWSEIGDGVYKGKKTYLLENDQYGDETNFLLVNEQLEVLSDEVFDFDCLKNPEDYIY